MKSDNKPLVLASCIIGCAFSLLIFMFAKDTYFVSNSGNSRNFQSIGLLILILTMLFYIVIKIKERNKLY